MMIPESVRSSAEVLGLMYSVSAEWFDLVHISNKFFSLLIRSFIGYDHV